MTETAIEKTPAASKEPKAGASAKGASSKTGAAKGKPKAKTKGPGLTGQRQVLPLSAGTQEVEITLRKAAYQAFEKKAELASRGSRFGKLTAADIIADQAFHTDELSIDKAKDETVTVKLVIPAFALGKIDALAKEHDVSVDRIVEEMGLKLK